MKKELGYVPWLATFQGVKGHVRAPKWGLG